MHYIHEFTSYIQIYFTNTIFCVASIQTHIIWILHIDFPYANSSPRHYFFWKPLGWKDLNNNGNPNWIKGGMHLHRNGLSFLLQLFHQVTDIPCRVTNDTQPLKEKSQVLQSCTKKKKAIRWIEAELFFGLFVSSSSIMLLLLYAWGTCQRKSNSSKFGRDLAKINEGRTKKDSRYSRKCRIEWREVKMLETLVTCSWSWRGKQMWAIITTCIATTDSLS